LVVLLAKTRKVGVLAQELTLQRIGTRNALRGIQDVSGVLLSRSELVLDALLIDASIASKIGLVVLDRLLGQLGRLVVVLEKQVVSAVADVLG